MEEEIVRILNNLGVKYRKIEHPAVFTVEESIKLVEGKKPIKSLMLQEKGAGRIVLVIMSGDKRLDLKSLKDQLQSKKLQFAD